MIRLKNLAGLTVLAVLLHPGMALALDVHGKRVSLSADYQFLEDPQGELTLDMILEEPELYPFIDGAEEHPEGAFAPVWIRLQLNLDSAARQQSYYLFAHVENLFEIALYRPDGYGGYFETVTGNNHPAYSREVTAPRYGFLIEPGAEENIVLYMRVVSGLGINGFPWSLVEKSTYETNADTYYGFDVACLGAVAALLIFNALIAFSLRAPEYTFYCFYLFSVMMALLTLDGIAFYYLWPELPALNTRAPHTFNLLSASMRLLTIMYFLKSGGFAPRMHRCALGVLAMLGITLLLVLVFGVNKLPHYIATIAWAIAILFGFAICIQAVRQKVPMALSLLITLIVPGATAGLQAIITINNPHTSVFILQLAKVGFVVHTLLFSLCLATHMRLENTLRNRALHDSLTGLPGTLLLQEQFELAVSMAQRQGTQVAICFIDLDGFKAVNDRLGHAAGDQLLVEVAGRLQAELTRVDTVARIGGDEFVVMLSQVRDKGEVHQLARTLLHSIARPFDFEGNEVRVSGSIGVALHPLDGTDLEGLLKVADQAMYRAKRESKNAYIFTESMDAGEAAPLWRLAV
ncbi:diguanylate cyclase [Pseudohalioglobus lutimaris]|uniref:GGDEF domain-containing protein n=1 Tax=Pseudohalioglobus lutimaris TaxID=1737061 RepID=A0A2N5X5C2_9GAMM|nr:diguanylate cyclase [Pseudohalioglobus lutimaris]PLW69692.1 GGDEF domain-containing protein [Pseudohalioglobus lutimaris]